LWAIFERPEKVSGGQAAPGTPREAGHDRCCASRRARPLSDGRLVLPCRRRKDRGRLYEGNAGLLRISRALRTLDSHRFQRVVTARVLLTGSLPEVPEQQSGLPLDRGQLEQPGRLPAHCGPVGSGLILCRVALVYCSLRSPLSRGLSQTSIRLSRPDLPPASSARGARAAAAWDVCVGNRH